MNRFLRFFPTRYYYFLIEHLGLPVAAIVFLACTLLFVLKYDPSPVVRTEFVIAEVVSTMDTLKWSGKLGQRAKMYPTRTNGYENDKATELFRPV